MLKCLDEGTHFDPQRLVRAVPKNPSSTIYALRRVFFFCFLFVPVSFIGTRRQWYCSSHTPIHVALFTDETTSHLSATSVVIRSILKNTQSANQMTFHIFTPTEGEALARAVLACYFPKNVDAEIRLHTLQANQLSNEHTILSSSDQRLSNPLNFARFRLPDLLPEVSKVLYMDIDILVIGDIAKLFRSHLCHNSRKSIAVAKREATTLGRMLDFGHPVIRRLKLDQSSRVFNAGFMLINLEAWRYYSTSKTIEQWIRVNEEAHIYSHGTQPPLLLTFPSPSMYETFDSSWNVDGLGWRLLSVYELQRARILHWTGPRKPWQKNGRYKELWHTYEVELCKNVSRV